jgi:hypothetical protein
LEEVYKEDTPDPDDDLYPQWQRMMEQRQNHLDEARLRIVREPDPEDAFSIGKEIQFREDEESSAWMVAQTRLGQESITVIPLERLGDSTARLFPHNEHVALDHGANRATQYRLLQRSLRISHFALVAALRHQEDTPPLFRDSALLRNTTPLWLSNGEAEVTWSGQTYLLTLDAKLGLVIEQKETN